VYCEPFQGDSDGILAVRTPWSRFARNTRRPTPVSMNALSVSLMRVWTPLASQCRDGGFRLINRRLFLACDDAFTEVKHKLQVIKGLAMESGRVSVAMERFLEGKNNNATHVCPRQVCLDTNCRSLLQTPPTQTCCNAYSRLVKQATQVSATSFKMT
jgi:hypothetical protein